MKPIDPMFLTSLLIPLAMVFAGLLFRKRAPKKINHFFGYRTSMSMKNRETWEFAHHHVGKNMLTVGSIMLLVSAVLMLCVTNCCEALAVSQTSFVVAMAQLVILIATLVPTEKALNKHFDKDGNRKE